LNSKNPFSRRKGERKSKGHPPSRKHPHRGSQRHTHEKGFWGQIKKVWNRKKKKLPNQVIGQPSHDIELQRGDMVGDIPWEEKKRVNSVTWGSFRNRKYTVYRVKIVRYYGKSAAGGRPAL